MKLPPPNAIVAATGEKLRTLGEPEQVLPGGVPWVFCLTGEGRVRPVAFDQLARLEGSEDLREQREFSAASVAYMAAMLRNAPRRRPATTTEED